MEEDIKILEEIIEYCKEHLPPYYKDRDLQAIENLIKGYRELYKKHDDLLVDVYDLFVPKSKIKEKIEDFIEHINESSDLDDEKIWCGNEIVEILNILKDKLLEDK